MQQSSVLNETGSARAASMAMSSDEGRHSSPRNSFGGKVDGYEDGASDTADNKNQGMHVDTYNVVRSYRNVQRSPKCDFFSFCANFPTSASYILHRFAKDGPFPHHRHLILMHQTGEKRSQKRLKDLLVSIRMLPSLLLFSQSLWECPTERGMTRKLMPELVIRLAQIGIHGHRR